MNVKRRLVESLPDAAKRLLARPYDLVQTRRADRRFRARERPAVTPADDAPRHVVVLVVDALRGDAIDEETTPFLASLQGTTDAITPSGWTFPSVSSMLTGRYPHEHGAIRAPDADHGDEFVLPPQMADDELVLTDYFAAAGYDTYGGFGHDTPFVALSGRFATHDLSHQVDADAADVLANHRDWLLDRAGGRTFSYVHLADPHIPVTPPEEYLAAHDVDASIPNLQNWDYERTTDPDADGRRYREHRRRLYTAAVDYVDDCLREHVERLRDSLDDVAVVVTSDHGESMWEHVETDLEHFHGNGCVGHGGTPYEPLTRVPLLSDELPFSDRSDGPISLIDVAPTILSAAGIDEQVPTTGRDLHDADLGDRLPLVEGSLGAHELKAVYDGDRKLIASEAGPRLTVALPGDVPTDVEEARTERLLDSLPPWNEDLGRGTEVSDVVGDRLDALGYR